MSSEGSEIFASEEGIIFWSIWSHSTSQCCEKAGTAVQDGVWNVCLTSLTFRGSQESKSWSIWQQLSYWAFLFSAVWHYSVITWVFLPRESGFFNFFPTSIEVKDVQVLQEGSLRFLQFFFPSFLRFSCCLAGGWLVQLSSCIVCNNWSHVFLAFFPLSEFSWMVFAKVDSLNEVLVRPPVSAGAGAAKPSLGALPSLIRLHTNVHHFTAWLISPKISRFFTSFWQWKAGRRAFNWAYITETLHLCLLYKGMENWPQIFQSCNE